MKIGLATASTVALLVLTANAFADEEPAAAQESKVEETAQPATPKPMPVDPVIVPVRGPVEHDRPASTSTPKAADNQTGVVATFVASRPMQLGSSGNEAERSCAGLGTQCTAEASSGGGFMFAVGGMWKYIGFDILGGLSVDGGDRSFIDGNGARQSYSVSRAGAFAAARVRGSYQMEHVRFIAAAGPGASLRAVGLSKESLGVPQDGNTYSSLALTADLGVQWRMSKSAALAAGAMLWVEDAGQDVKTHAILGHGDRHLVSGVQTMLMPYIGLQFGP